jgi:acetolactate synthase-1/3 small subunit
VENQAGVLSRISGLISRRGYNIDSLSVGETEDPRFSRITVVIRGDSYVIEQIEKQVGKLFDVVNIKELRPEESIYRELALIKVKAESVKRAEVVAIVDIFRANIIDVSNTTITVEITGDQQKINAFCGLVEPYGIAEIARTGLTGLERGKDNIKEINFLKED